MAVQPDFSKAASAVGFAPLTTGRALSDGSGTLGTNLFIIGTAGANGAELEKVEFLATATAAATAVGQTVGRIFISSQTGTSATTSANTVLVKEIALPNDTADSTTAAVNPHVVYIGLRVPANYTVVAAVNATPNASSAWVAVAYLRDY